MPGSEGSSMGLLGELLYARAGGSARQPLQVQPVRRNSSVLGFFFSLLSPPSFSCFFNGTWRFILSLRLACCLRPPLQKSFEG